MLTGNGATPAFWSRSLKSSTTGIPFAAVIQAAPEHDRAPIVRRTAADHACAVEVDHLAAELARIAPIVGPQRAARRVQKVVRPATAIGRPVVRPGLQ